MSLIILDKTPEAQNICVVVEDECNHADAQTERVEHNNDHDSFVYNVTLQVWFEDIEICQGCGFYRRDGEQDWDNNL